MAGVARGIRIDPPTDFVIAFYPCEKLSVSTQMSFDDIDQGIDSVISFRHLVANLLKSFSHFLKLMIHSFVHFVDLGFVHLSQGQQGRNCVGVPIHLVSRALMRVSDFVWFSANVACCSITVFRRLLILMYSSSVTN